MLTTDLPPRDEMMAAFMDRDPAYDGVFFTAVETTGIFCRPTCPARKPREDNCRFFATARDALLSGYRACRRCRPLEPSGDAPPWLADLLAEVEADPTRRWRDQDLRERGLTPERVRRWFQKNHGMTFHAYHRARRLGLALGRIRLGADVTSSAFDSGYDSLSGFNEAFRQLFGEAPTEARGQVILHVTRVLTPLGPMLVGADDDTLLLAEFTDRRMLATQIERLRKRLGCAVVPGDNAVIELFADELERFFDGELRHFTTPLADPGTDFQRQVWNALREIPFGSTTSYGELARTIGRPQAVRAVARANGDNRLAIIIPCHRVIGSDGRLTGYGGGLWRKRRLLDHEMAVASEGEG